MEKSKKGVVMILLAGLLWGTAGFFVRTLNAAGLSTMQVVFVRVLLTAVIVLAAVALYDRRLLRIRLKDLWCFIGTGLLSIVSFYYFYFATMASASLAVAAVLLYTAPIFVMLLSFVLFREKLTGKKIVACLVAFAGCVLVTGVLSGGEARLSAGSILTGLLSGIGYALYSIFSRFALKRGYSSLTVTVYTFCIAAICLIPFADYGAIAAALTAEPAGVAAASAGLALAITVAPYLLYTKGLESVSASRAAIMASLEPVVASVVSVAVYHEPMGLTGAVGIGLVIGAIVLLNLPAGGEK